MNIPLTDYTYMRIPIGRSPTNRSVDQVILLLGYIMYDPEIVLAFAQEIGERYKKIMEYIPKEKENLLKHLASSAIHSALFARDILDDIKGQISEDPENAKQFFADCGCNHWRLERIDSDKK